jgi:type III pantothenate kinase
MNHKILADIGNTHFHIYDGKKVEHLLYEDAIDKYKEKELLFISVKHQLSNQIDEIKQWKNISSLVQIEGEYDTMGVDRKALCLSHADGVFVDAGSAITVDIVKNGRYMGGYIVPGLKAYLASYKSISSALDVTLCEELDMGQLYGTTKEQISYGIIASIKALIEKHSEGKKLYFTGGDGKFLSQYFDTAVYDEMLVFNGMLQALKDK